MQVLKKRVGDIYVNPILGDLWVLNKIWSDEDTKDVWMLNLVNNDYQEQLANVAKFIKVGNIYDLVNEKLRKERKQ